MIILSHFERRNTHRPVAPLLCSHVDKRFTSVDEVDPTTERVVRKSEFRTINRAEEMNVFKCSDFSLSNLLAVGVELRPCKLSTSTLSTLDKMETHVSNLSNSIRDNINTSNIE